MWQVIKDFFQSYKNHPWWFLSFIFFLVVGVACSLILPYFMKEIIDLFVAFVSTPDLVTTETVLVTIGLWLLVAVIWNLSTAVKNLAFWTLMNFNYTAYAIRTYKKILEKDIALFNKQKGGYLVDVFDKGVSARWSICMQFINTLLPMLLSFIAILVFAFYFSAKLTLVLLFIIPLQIFFSWYGYKISKKPQAQSTKSWFAAFAMTGDVFQNIYAVKSYNQEEAEVERFQKKMHRSIAKQLKANIRWAVVHVLAVENIGRAAVLIVGFMLLMRGEITIGVLIMFMTFIQAILGPLHFVANALNDVQRKNLEIEKLEKIAAAPAKVLHTSGSHTASSVQGEISLKNVSFSYGKKKILKNISLHIKPGERVALVGPSGAGKSTLALLISRFHDPQKGVVLLDGVPYKTWDYDDFRSHFAMVWQENMLFHESLQHNIGYGTRRAKKKDIEKAASQANVLPFIRKQKKQLKTIVGERGIHLSGGEKQRVMIARAMLKNADVVILDEATSALDSITEKAVQEGIANLIQEKTAVIIAHRLSTIKSVDRIFVLDEGRIVARGTHQALMKKSPLYKHMVSLQVHGLLDEHND